MRSMLDYTKTSDTSHSAKDGPDSVAPVVIPALVPTLDMSLKADRSLCPVGASCYYIEGPQNSGSIKIWSLSPSRRASTKIYLLSLSLHGSSRLCSYATSSLIKRPLPCIRLKPMMLGPLLLLRHSSQESLWNSYYQPIIGNPTTPLCSFTRICSLLIQSSFIRTCWWLPSSSTTSPYTIKQHITLPKGLQGGSELLKMTNKSPHPSKEGLVNNLESKVN